MYSQHRFADDYVSLPPSLHPRNWFMATWFTFYISGQLFVKALSFFICLLPLCVSTVGTAASLQRHFQQQISLAALVHPSCLLNAVAFLLDIALLPPPLHSSKCIPYQRHTFYKYIVHLPVSCHRAIFQRRSCLLFAAIAWPVLLSIACVQLMVADCNPNDDASAKLIPLAVAFWRCYIIMPDILIKFKLCSRPHAPTTTATHSTASIHSFDSQLQKGEIIIVHKDPITTFV